MALPTVGETAGISSAGVHGGAEAIRTRYQFVAETKGVDAALLAIRRFTQANDKLDKSSSLDEIHSARRKGLMALEQTLDGAAGSMANLSQTAGKMQPVAENLGLTMDQYRVMIDKAARKVRPFNFALLGVMFAGMQLSRIFGGLLRDMVSGFRNAQEANSAFNTQMSQLGARVQHLRFQFVDAFIRTPLFQVLIEGATRLLDWLSSLSDRTKSWLMTSMLIAALLATMVFIGGSILAWSQSVRAAWIGIVAASAAKNGLLSKIVIKSAAMFGWIKASAIALGVIALGLGASIWLFSRISQKAKEFEGNWGAAFAYTFNEVGVFVGKTLQVLDDMMTTIKLWWIDLWRILFNYLGQGFGKVVNAIIDEINEVLAAFNRTGFFNFRMLSNVTDRAFQTGDLFMRPLMDRTVSEWSDRRDEHLARLDAIKRENENVDRFYGVIDDFSEVTNEFESSLESLKNMETPGATGGDFIIGEININGASDPSLTYQQFKLELERAFEDSKLTFGAMGG